MDTGFVLITVEPTHDNEVLEKLTKIPEVIELHSLFGEYDIMVKIEAENHEKLGGIVVSKIRTIDGVADTKTLTGTKFSTLRK